MDTSPAPPEHWVPVEHRIGGIDRRTVAPALLVLALAIFFSLILPAINNAVDYGDEIAAGDVIDLGEGRLTFVPAEGWDLAGGVRTGAARGSIGVPTVAEVVRDGVSFKVTTGPFDGTPKEFMTQLETLSSKLDDVDGLAAPAQRATISTEGGLRGVTRTSFEGERRGFLAAFVIPVDPPISTRSSIGLEVLVKGRADAVLALEDDITSMLDSITLEEAK
jgi:hypothetical protein